MADIGRHDEDRSLHDMDEDDMDKPESIHDDDARRFGALSYAALSTRRLPRLRWNDPAPIWLAAIAFTVVGGARFLADQAAKSAVPVALGYAAVFAGCCYVVGVLLCSWFDSASGLRPASWLAAAEPVGLRRSLRQRFFVYWFVLLACWAPWLAFCWPGVMRDDTIAQFMQSAGYHQYFTQHPLFDTLVFGLFWRAGGLLGNQVWGLALYVVVQALLMAANLSLVLCYLRAYGIPRIAVGIGLLYCATFYAVVGAVPTMSKDSLCTVFMVPLALLIADICLTKGETLKRPWVCVAFVALMALGIISKRTVVVILLCVTIGLVIAASKARLRVVCCFLAAAVLALGVWSPLSEHFTAAHESVDRDVFGFVMLPVARLQAQEPSAITAQERAELLPAMDLWQAGRQYDDTRSDETSWTMNTEATEAQKLAAFKAWAQIGMRHSLSYLKAYATIDYDWYYPDHGIAFPADSNYLFGSDYMRQWNTFVTPPMTAQRALHDFTTSLRPLTKFQLQVVDATKRVIDLPIASYAVYLTYLPLLLAVYFISRRRWRQLAGWSILGFTVFSLYASPIVLCWFATPAFDMLPLMVGLGFVGRSQRERTRGVAR